MKSTESGKERKQRLVPASEEKGSSLVGSRDSAVARGPGPCLTQGSVAFLLLRVSGSGTITGEKQRFIPEVMFDVPQELRAQQSVLVRTQTRCLGFLPVPHGAGSRPLGVS